MDRKRIQDNIKFAVYKKMQELDMSDEPANLILAKTEEMLKLSKKDITNQSEKLKQRLAQRKHTKKSLSNSVCIESGNMLGDEMDEEPSSGDMSVIITSGFEPLLPQPKKKQPIP